MSGIFGYDGYAYQSNVCLKLVLGKISEGKNVQKFLMEVRLIDPTDARKDEYTVDLIIYFAPGNSPHSEVTEIKGGENPDIDDACANVERCSSDILAASPTTAIVKQIVVRDEGEATILPNQIARNPIADRFVGTDGYSELDHSNISLIKKIIENEVNSKKREYVARGILRTLKHFIDFRLRELAWKLREEGAQPLQSCEIAIRDFFYFEDSFADFMLLESENFSHKNQALAVLTGINEHGQVYTGGTPPFTGDGSPAVDAG